MAGKETRGGEKVRGSNRLETGGSTSWDSHHGAIFPLGVTWIPEEQAYNFSLYSKHAEQVTLLLYGKEDPKRPLFELPMEYLSNKTARIWHCRIRRDEIPRARYYAYSVSGGSSGGPGEWQAFDPEKVLLDPYATCIHFPPAFDRVSAIGPGSNAGRAMLGVLPAESASAPSGPPPQGASKGVIAVQGGEFEFDWGDDRSFRRHYHDTVIYEMHVRGFTMSPTSGIDRERRGTFAGVIDKIGYLRELGVTAVELMPVHQFDPDEGNYWGYMPINFFSPQHSYAFDREDPRREFREMVKALHAAGIEVILDVIYNHTGEGDHTGPTYSFKGIDNSTYYLMGGDPESPYLNYSGTGNTLHCANRHVRTMIVDSLRYWVTEMHVDGFRFDLASVFSRNSDGSINHSDPPLFTAIRADPALHGIRLIAEPWDAAGAYQLGTAFPGRLWLQWNGKFRDDIRKFLRGDPDMVPAVMRRVYGSDDLFPDTFVDACRPFQGINYFASHDGFSLHDLVSYNERRNQANGHDNTDGPAEEFSWNCGWEGDEDAPVEVVALRERQAKNYFALLLLANGIPMFRAGDEFLQTQKGNNNPYNQDNETSWLDWERLRTRAGFFRFVKRMIAFRKAHPTLCRSRFWREDVRWHGVGADVDMSSDSHTLAYYLSGARVGDRDLYVMINAYEDPLVFTVEEGEPGEWKRVIDTGLESPDDILGPGEEAPLAGSEYPLEGRSVVVLMR